MKSRQESERQPTEMTVRLNSTSDEGRYRTSMEVWGVFMMCLSVDSLQSMGCVEIDVETDTLEYHPDIDCCLV